MQALAATELAALVDTTGLAGVSVRWVTEPSQKSSMSQLLVDAATALTHDEQQSRDSFAWFTGSNDDVQRRRDGMTLDAQGLTPLMLSLSMTNALRMAP